MPRIFKTIAEFRDWRKALGGTLALVPTMGALHDGHISLIERAKAAADHTVVYIFVNPLQFGPNEDFAAYPRTLEADTERCRQAGVDAVFHPSEDEIYPHGKDNCTKVVPPADLADVLEGAYRPGFFTGVATVLAKFFAIVEPDKAIFGEKDFQQLLIVRRMVADLNMPVKVIGAPLIREKDGLAGSSRNIYLTAEKREVAAVLYQALQATAEAIEQRKQQTIEQCLAIGKGMIESTKQFTIQYFEARDSITLLPHEQAENDLVILVAAKLDGVRLIDNVVCGRARHGIAATEERTNADKPRAGAYDD
jgi:pantoate--beta-alanine ligase